MKKSKRFYVVGICTKSDEREIISCFAPFNNRRKINEQLIKELQNIIKKEMAYDDVVILTVIPV